MALAIFALAALALALCLKPLLAWRMLHDEVLAVEVALGQSLPAGRAQLARHGLGDLRDLGGHRVGHAVILGIHHFEEFGDAHRVESGGARVARLGGSQCAEVWHEAP